MISRLGNNICTMKKIISIITVFICFTTIGIAQIPDRPVPPQLVNDFANLLTESERAQLEDTLVGFANRTSTQIVVVTVPDLEDTTPEILPLNWEKNGELGKKIKTMV